MKKDYSYLKNKNRLEALPKKESHWHWSKNPTIPVLHKRLYREMGKASNYKCVDCGKKAKDWSLKKGKKYSDSFDDYEPRCRKCHIKYDNHIETRRKNNLKKGIYVNQRVIKKL